MKIRKERKPRGYKANGDKSIDFCPYCFRPGCDCMGGSPLYRRKVDKRLEAGLCPACGHMPCTCKSRDLSEKATADRELWIAQRKCLKCKHQENCDKVGAIKCKLFAKIVE